MKIYSNGKDRELKGAFPKKFKLLNNGEDVPFLRTGKETIWLSDDIPFGELDIEEVVQKKVPQPAKLDAQSLAIINKSDFDKIDLLNKKLAINQEQMNAQMIALTEQEASLANLETQNAQNIDQTNLNMAEMAKAFGKEIQVDRESLKATAKSIAQDIEDTALILNANLEEHKKAKNPHKITKETVGLDKVDNTSDLDKPISKATQKALDKKADKKDIEEVDKKISDAGRKQDELLRNLDTINLYGGVGGNELPTGGKKGYVLAKKSNKTGDYEWKAGGGGVSVHNELTGRSAEDCHPISSITNLQSTLTSETTNRENADIGLQGQIDAITASSDVKDIVGTYAQLQSYDTSTLGNNDIIKVLQDESHDDETTYYRWSTSTETFTLIGEEGPYYTKSAADAQFVPQTRTVNGKALSADISLTASDVGALPYNTTIGDATLTIQKNGTTIDTFTANATSNKTVNVTVPTDTSDLTNGAGYITSSALSNYVTTNTTQTVTGQKTFLRTESQFQDSVARFVSTYNSSNTGWRGRVIIGAKDYTFLIGTYNGMAALCGHKFTNSATEEGAAWSDIYFSPDGDKSLYFGGNSWRPSSGWFKVQNSGSNTGGKTQVNIGSISSANWKDVAYKGENISDFNNDSGYTSNMGTVTSVNNVSPVNGNVSLSIPTVNDSTIKITQGGVAKGSFTLNQASGGTIALDAGSGTYSAGSGIDITSGVISNDGVRSISTGTTNGTISVNTGGTSADVSVYGLGSAAYTASTDYAKLASANTFTAANTFNIISYYKGSAIMQLSSNYYYFMDRTDLATGGTTPSSVKYEICPARAANGDIVGQLAFCQDTSGNYYSQIQTYSKVSGTSKNAYIRVGVDSAGNSYTYAPTPTSATDNTTKIATTAWTNDATKNGNLIGVPNFSAGVSGNSGTASVNGFLYAQNKSGSGGADATLTVGSITFKLIWIDSLMIPIPKGTSYSITGGTTPQCIFYPCKGG